MLMELGRGLSPKNKKDMQVPPVNTVAPATSGTARVGQTLSSTDGTWTGAPVPTFAYQWRRDGGNIGGATANTYVLTSADMGHAIDCYVTATNAAGSASQDSNNITVSAYLDAVIASAVFDLDVTKSASYGGTGTTWANLIATPADSSAQTAYDFYRGDGAASGTYPTFNGSAGSSSAYWSFDGGDYFKLKSGTNTSFLNSLHRTTGGTDFWIAFVFHATDASWSTQPFFSTQQNTASTNDIGIYAQFTSGRVARMFGSNVGGASTSVMGAGDHIVLISHSHSGNGTRFWVDTLTAETISHTFETQTGNPTGTAMIGALGDASAFINSDKRLYGFAMGNEYLDNTKAGAIIAAIEARHGRDYTP